MRPVTGTVQAVSESAVGSWLVTDASASSATITLSSVSDFPDSGQALLQGADEVFETVTYTSVDRTTGVLTLSGVTTNAFVAGDAALVVPLQSVWVAWVSYGPPPAGLVLASVPFEFRDKLPVGTRDAVGGIGEKVVVDLDTLAIIAVPTTIPSIDGTLITPGTLPTTGSDGNPPGSSPTPTVMGGIGYLAIKWTPVSNNDTVTYEVHVSTTTGFTPSGATKVGENNGTLFFIRQLPDGSPLLYDTTYYVKTVAKDEDGSAAASSQGSGTMVQATTPDIAAEAIVAGHILSGTITAEQLATVLTITNRLVAGTESGQRVEIDSDGVRLISPTEAVTVNLPTDADATATFAGSLTASDITIEDRLRLQGTDNEISSSAELTVAGGVSTPTSAPSASMSWQQLDLDDSSVLPHRGLWYDANGTAGGATPVFLYCEKGVGGRLIEVIASTGAVNRTMTFSSTLPYQQPYGVTRIGSNIWVLFAESSEQQIWVPGHWEGRHWIPGHYETTGTVTYKLRKVTQATFASAGDTTLSSSDVGAPNQSYPGVGSDGTYICIVTQVGKAQGPKVVRYNTTPAVNDSITLTDMTPDDQLTTPEFYSFVSQGGNWWITLRSTSESGHLGETEDELSIGCYAFNTSGVFITDRVFDIGGDAMRGTVHDGTQFRTIHEGSVLYQHTNWDWTTESPKYWVAYSWYDSAGTTHETAVSGVQPITISRRAQLVVSTLSALPGAGGADDPDSIRVYANRGTTMPVGGSPTRFAGYLQGSGASSYTMTTFDNAGSPPENPSASDFPSAPALLESAGGVWQLYGDGTKVGFTSDEFFGDGSDGSAVFDGSGTVLGLTPSSGVYTLVRDVFAQDITIQNGATILPSSFRIFCQGTLTIDTGGSIKANAAAGSDGSGATGGAGGANGSSIGGIWPMLITSAGNGGAGASNVANGGTEASPGTSAAATNVWLFEGGNGGDANLLTNGTTGRDTVAAKAPTAAQGDLRTAAALSEGLVHAPASYLSAFGGAGGGGACYRSSYSGGGGGGGGGAFLVAAKRIVNNGAIEAKGAAGGNGTSYGGGGGGGGGGLVGLLYNTYTGSQPVVTGGAGGANVFSSQGAQSAGSLINTNTDTTSYASGTVGATAGKKVLIAVHSSVSSGTPNVPSMSGTNGWNATYTQVATQLYNGNLNRLTLFRLTQSSSSSGVVTAAFSGQTQTGCQAVAVVPTALAVNWVSETPTQVATPTSGSTGDASVSLDSAPAAGSTVVAFTANTATAANVTAGTGYTEAAEVNHASGSGTLEVEATSQIGFPSQSAAWTNTSGPWAAISVEMDSNSGAGVNHGTGFTSVNNTTDAASFATGTVSAVSGRHVLVAVHSSVSSGTANEPTLSGTNGWNATYTKVAGTLYNGNLNRLTVFRHTNASGTSGVLTADFASQTQTGCHIVSVVPSEGSAPNWLSQTPVQASTPATGSSGNASVSLGSAPNSRHSVVAFTANVATAANVAPDDFHTEIVEVNHASGAGTLEAAYTASANKAVQTINWTNTSGAWAAISMEMDTDTVRDGAAGAAGLVRSIQV